MISGPDDTPYSGGLFAFDIFFPHNYPQSPPKVKLMTTGGGTHRFNPNLYAGEMARTFEEHAHGNGEGRKTGPSISTNEIFLMWGGRSRL